MSLSPSILQGLQQVLAAEPQLLAALLDRSDALLKAREIVEVAAQHGIVLDVIELQAYLAQPAVTTPSLSDEQLERVSGGISPYSVYCFGSPHDPVKDAVPVIPGDGDPIDPGDTITIGQLNQNLTWPLV